ncbi:13897_t:CDS:2, partial [Funneliformis geosporum]
MSDETSLTIGNINFRDKRKREVVNYIWLHFIRNNTETPGKFGAECKYCSSKFVKELNAGYNPPTHEYLSDRIVE